MTSKKERITIDTDSAHHKPWINLSWHWQFRKNIHLITWLNTIVICSWKGDRKSFPLFYFKSILEAYYSFVFSHFSFLFFFSLLIGTFFILLFSFSLPFLFLLPLPHSLPLYFLSFSLFLIWTFWCLFSCLSSYFFKIILFYMNNN